MHADAPQCALTCSSAAFMPLPEPHCSPQQKKHPTRGQTERLPMIAAEARTVRTARNREPVSERCRRGDRSVWASAVTTAPMRPVMLVVAVSMNALRLRITSANTCQHVRARRGSWLYEARCARVGGHGRAYRRARRRSCRRRWLPTGRSGPRAPGGVGRGSRRRLSPPLGSAVASSRSRL